MGNSSDQSSAGTVVSQTHNNAWDARDDTAYSLIIKTYIMIISSNDRSVHTVERPTSTLIPIGINLSDGFSQCECTIINVRKNQKNDLKCFFFKAEIFPVVNH